MNTIKSLILSAVLTVLAASALVAPASAKNLDQMWAETLDAQNNAVNVTSGASTCATFYYTGTSSEAVLAITQTAMTAYAPQGTPDTNFGTAAGAYTLSAAAYDTMGELCAAINANTSTSKYSCQLQGCKYDDASANMRDQAAVSNSNTVQPLAFGLTAASNLGAAAGYTVLQDTGGITVTTIVGSSTTFYESIGINPAVGRRVVLKQCKQNTAGTGTLSVYGSLRKYDGAADGVTRNSSTLVWQEPTTAATALTETWAISGWGGLDFGVGKHVVIRAGDGSSASNVTGFLQCEWDER